MACLFFPCFVSHVHFYKKILLYLLRDLYAQRAFNRGVAPFRKAANWIGLFFCLYGYFCISFFLWWCCISATFFITLEIPFSSESPFHFCMPKKNPQDLKCQICNYSFLPWASLIGEWEKIEQWFTINWKHIFRKENQTVWEFLHFSIIQYSAYARFSWHRLK